MNLETITVGKDGVLVLQWRLKGMIKGQVNPANFFHLIMTDLSDQQLITIKHEYLF